MDSRFKPLHEGIPHENLKSRKTTIKEGGEGNTSNKEELKAELNAMTAFMTEDAWAFIKKWIDENPNTIAGKPSRFKPNTKYFTVEDILTGIISTRPKDEYHVYKVEPGLIVQLADISYTTVALELVEWEKKKETLDPKSTEYKQYSRYKALLKKSIDRDPEPLTELRKGFTTALENMWTILGAIPDVYLTQKGRVITESDYSTIAKNSISLLNHLAQLDINIFAVLQNVYSRQGDILRAGRVPVNDYFKITGENQTLSLTLKDAAIATATNTNPNTRYSPHLRTGCPAIHSKGTTNKNVIGELYDYVLDLNKKLFIPYLKANNLMQQ